MKINLDTRNTEYSCSACDHNIKTTFGKFILWDKRSKTEVKICMPCYKKLKKYKLETVNQLHKLNERIHLWD